MLLSDPEVVGPFPRQRSAMFASMQDVSVGYVSIVDREQWEAYRTLPITCDMTLCNATYASAAVGR
jgi:hypothetical protein